MHADGWIFGHVQDRPVWTYGCHEGDDGDSLFIVELDIKLVVLWGQIELLWLVQSEAGSTELTTRGHIVFFLNFFHLRNLC